MMKKILIIIIMTFVIVFSSQVSAVDFVTTPNTYFIQGNKSTEDYSFLCSSKSTGTIVSGVMFYKTETYLDYEIYDYTLIDYQGFTDEYVSSSDKTITISRKYIDEIIQDNITTDIGFEYQNYTTGIRYDYTNTVIKSRIYQTEYKVNNASNFEIGYSNSTVGTGLAIYKKFARIKLHTYYRRQTGPINHVYWTDIYSTEEFDVLIDVSFLPLSFTRFKTENGKKVIDKSSVLFCSNDPYETFLQLMVPSNRDKYRKL